MMLAHVDIYIFNKYIYIYIPVIFLAGTRLAIFRNKANQLSSQEIYCIIILQADAYFFCQSGERGRKRRKERVRELGRVITRS